MDQMENAAIRYVKETGRESIPLWLEIQYEDLTFYRADIEVVKNLASKMVKAFGTKRQKVQFEILNNSMY